MSDFSNWLDTFISEKGINPERILEAEGKSGPNFIPVQILVDAIKTAPNSEQTAIKNMIVKIDFLNGNVVDYFQHLAKAIAI